MMTLVNKKATPSRRRRAVVRMTVVTHAPARKQKTSSKAKTRAVPTANGTRETTKAKNRMSCLMWQPVSSRSKTRTKGSTAVESRSVTRHNIRSVKHTEWLENQVHQAIAVIDTDTKKFLSYKQLIKDPKYKKKW